MITFERHPDAYKHWKLDIDGTIATLTMAVDPASPLMGDYELKLNSYDIGVDIELADAIRRIRFEHPSVRCVVMTGGIAGTFCAGANIRMLAAADHAHKVNFCKFTNETRLEIEDASANSGIRFLAAVNGACSGGGYELALACDHILLVDDRNTSVSLPEVPLLGVLPGTGGLTRVTDKRGVRRDRADVFATRAEGSRGAEALEWRLIDELATPTNFDAAVADRAAVLAADGDHLDGEATPLPPLDRTVEADLVTYRHVSARFDRRLRSCDLTVSASSDADWLLTTARELDDVLCHIRFNEPEVATIVLRTVGEHDVIRAHDARLHEPATRRDLETALFWQRVLSRLDLTARTLLGAIEPGSCALGVMAELMFAADRTYMLDGVFQDDDDPSPPAVVELTRTNIDKMLMANGLSRCTSRLWRDETAQAACVASAGTSLDAAAMAQIGLVTATPDDLDWQDELRLALEERASFSPDALTGMEANHRFCGPETMATKIFSRLSVWQNWIFIRPNASGPDGALARYGSGARPSYSPIRT
ncbi:MAG: benzoyl-CoA-dihydrodiol lyase [Candidatus Poriferisodalaceae bacterium]|jgi:benzoyl-CoA-dihydrodiol lyase